MGELFLVKILFRQAETSVKVHGEVCGQELSYDNDHGIENETSYNPTSPVFFRRRYVIVSYKSDNIVPVFCD